MRILIALLIAAAANAAEEPVIYERDPQSLINRLLAAHPAGLLAIRAGEHEFQRTGGAQAEPRSDELAGPVVLSTCGRCHSGAGIFSVNSYTQFLSGGIRDAPQLAPAANTNYQFSATIEWKKGQFDWGLLQGLLERADSRRH